MARKIGGVIVDLQNTREELQRKIYLLRDELRRDHGVQLKWHDPKTTLIEGVLSRGDRRLGAVLESVWRDGGTFQEWSEYFELDRWERALAEAELTTAVKGATSRATTKPARPAQSAANATATVTAGKLPPPQRKTR